VERGITVGITVSVILRPDLTPSRKDIEMNCEIILRIPVNSADEADGKTSVCDLLAEWLCTKRELRRKEIAEWLEEQVTVEKVVE